jgi:signal transduction protein with GAF and PtsI domain
VTEASITSSVLEALVLFLSVIVSLFGLAVGSAMLKQIVRKHRPEVAERPRYLLPFARMYLKEKMTDTERRSYQICVAGLIAGTGVTMMATIGAGYSLSRGYMNAPAVFLLGLGVTVAAMFAVHAENLLHSIWDRHSEEFERRFEIREHGRVTFVRERTEA